MTKTVNLDPPALALACGCTRAHRCPHAERLFTGLSRVPTASGRRGVVTAYMIHRRALSPVFSRALDDVIHD